MEREKLITWKQNERDAKKLRRNGIINNKKNKYFWKWIGNLLIIKRVFNWIIKIL